MKWYYEKNEEQQGPFSLEEILPVITPVTLVWRESSLGDWVEAQKHPLLKTIFAEPNNIPEKIQESSVIENIKNHHTNDIHITLSFDGVWMILDATVKVYADDVLVGTGSLKNGFHIEFSVTKTQPIIIVKHAFRSEKIKINKLEIGKNYEIILGYDRYLKGNFNSSPVKIIKT